MLRRFLPLGALALLPLVVPFAFEGAFAGPPDPIAPDRDIATFVPERSLFYVEGCGLAPILDQGLEHPFVRTLLAGEFGRALLADAEQQPADLIAFADALIERPLLPALARLSSRGVAVAGTAKPGGGKFVLILLGSDATLLEQMLTRAFDLVEEKYGIPGALDRPRRTIRGADYWTLGEDLCVARRDVLFVAGNDEGLVRDVLDLAADADALGIMANDSFEALAGERANLPTLWAWADLERAEKQNPEGLAKLRNFNGNPGGQSLLGPGFCALGTSSTLSASLTVDEHDIVLDARGQGPNITQVLAPSESRFQPPPLLVFDDEVAHGLLYRDYGAIVRNRVDLFPAETLPKFAETVSNLALFFGGKDIGEDVLPGVSPWIQVVSRPLDYDTGRAPEIPLPGVALVAELENAGTRGPEVEAAFQSVISIINVDQAQKSGTMMQLRLQLEGDVQITSARYLAPGPEDGVDMRYNLEPACAVVGDYFVLGTHTDLVRAVVRRLSDSTTGVRTSAGAETLRIAGAPVAKAIQDNFETLVMNKVLEDGVERKEAEDEIGGIYLLLSTIEQMQLEVTYPVDDDGDDTIRFQAAIALEREAHESSR
jgi:hypothetical protein